VFENAVRAVETVSPSDRQSEVVGWMLTDRLPGYRLYRLVGVGGGGLGVDGPRGRRCVWRCGRCLRGGGSEMG